MKLFKTSGGILFQYNKKNYLLNDDWNTLINRDNLFEYLSQQISDDIFINATEGAEMMQFIQAFIGQQEVWAAR